LRKESGVGGAASAGYHGDPELFVGLYWILHLLFIE